jgi:hypothetical protein
MLLETFTMRGTDERESSGIMAFVTAITPKKLVSKTSRIVPTSAVLGVCLARSPEMPALLTACRNARLCCPLPPGSWSGR